MQRELTDGFIRTIRPPTAGRAEFWDTRVTGLALRVTPSGVMSWSIRARTGDGKRVRPSLGTWPHLSLSAARKRARAMLVDIEGGADPVAERRAAEAARLARSSNTIAARLQEWREARSARWADGYARSVQQICDREIAPSLGHKSLSETTRSDWTSLIARKQRQSEAAAANLFRTCSAFLNHAEAAGWIDHALLPRKGASLLAPPVAPRVRTLTEVELVSIWRAADGMAPKARAFVHLLAMSAARRQEVADVAKGEIDLERGRWSVPGTRAKNGIGITVPLHPLVIADIQAIWPAHECGPNWKLLGAIAGSGLSGFSKIKAKLDELSGTTNWHIHDLRRSARTGMARLGISTEHAEAALNHISGRSALVRTYDRHDYQCEIIAALERWQAHIASLLQAQATAEIVPLLASA
jgi:integrase